MKHRGTQRLETDRLVLRRYVNRDAEAMYKNWASDKEVTKFLTWPTHSSQEISEGVMEDWVNQYSSQSYYHWAIVLKDIERQWGRADWRHCRSRYERKNFNGAYWVLYWKNMAA